MTKYEVCILLIVTICIAVVKCAPQQPAEPIAIISQNTNIEPDGAYTYDYETANGIKGQETGTLKKATSADTNDVIIASGSVSYTDPEGNLITLTYTADDENGFVAQGAHLPTSPPIPPEIQKSLDYIASINGK